MKQKEIFFSALSARRCQAKRALGQPFALEFHEDWELVNEYSPGQSA
jgi:hypothetical protein